MAENRVVDIDLKDGKPVAFTGGKPNGKDDFQFITWNEKSQTVDWNQPARIWTSNLDRIVTEAAQRFAPDTIQQSDGWNLAATAPDNSLVFVDSSYFPTDDQLAAGKSVMNYGKTTLEDSNPEKWLAKFRQYLLPKSQQVRYVVTNNFNGRVVEQLEKSGWTVLRTYRGNAKSPTHEFIALSPAAAADAHLPAAQPRTLAPGGIPLAASPRGLHHDEPGTNRGDQLGLPAAVSPPARIRDPQPGLRRQGLASSPRLPDPVSDSGFYSRLQEAIRSAPFGQTEPKHPQQWGGVIQKWAGGRTAAASALWRAGIAKEELKWSGILPWLAAQNKPLTKAQVLDYLTTEGAVQFTEHATADRNSSADIDLLRQHGWQVQRNPEDETIVAFYDTVNEDMASASEIRNWATQGDIPTEVADAAERIERTEQGQTTTTRYAQYQLPGGTNYREVVLAMPVKSQNDPIQSFKRLADGSYDVIFRDGEEGSYDTLEEARADGNGTAEVKGVDEYRSSHFPNVPNYLAHMRLNDRLDAVDQPGTLIEELQSDRHQAARKNGYREHDFRIGSDGIPVGWTFKKTNLNEQRGREWDVYNSTGHRVLGGLSTEAEAREAAALQAGRANAGEVPDAPHRKDWPLALFKRALRDAVAAGKTWIGWTTAQTQADRYDLSKQVDKIGWGTADRGKNYTLAIYKNDVEMADSMGIPLEIPAEKLSNYVGKEIAQRILDSDGSGSLEGDGLKVGGEGMKGFYDHILPKTIGHYVKQWNATVEQDSIDASAHEFKVNRDSHTPPYRLEAADSPDILARFNTAEEAWAEAERRGQTPIWKVTITPEMRASIQSTGQPLFASTRDPSSQPPPLAGLLNLRYTDAHGNPITDANALREAHRASDPLSHARGSLPANAPQQRLPTTPQASLDWANETHWTLDRDHLQQRLEQAREIKGGQEHHVFFYQDRWVKITRGNGDFFGFWPGRVRKFVFRVFGYVFV